MYCNALVSTTILFTYLSLYNIFNNKEFKHVKAIVHYHEFLKDVYWRKYAPPGTVRDSVTKLDPKHTTFQIQGHGMFELLTEGELP